MIETLQDLHLVHERLQILDAVFLDGLDGVLLFCLSVLCKVDHSEATGRQLLDEVVLVLDLSLVRLREQVLNVHLVLLLLNWFHFSSVCSLKDWMTVMNYN